MTTTIPIQVQVHFYAQFREQAGVTSAPVSTSARTTSEFYQELKTLHHFQLDQSSLHVAVNDEFCDWNHPIQDGDSVTFVPPVAGG